MTLFALIGRDGSDGVALRKLHREAHLNNLQTLVEQGRLTYAGPLRDESGTPCGSVVLFEAADLAAARAFAQSDPYTLHGVFQTVEVFETLKVLPQD
jgi:uncharacterized protein YciI